MSFKTWLMEKLNCVPVDDYNELMNENVQMKKELDSFNKLDLLEKEDLIKQADECRKLYKEKLQEPAYDMITASPYWGFMNTPMPGQITATNYTFDEVDVPGTYKTKHFNDDSSSFIQYQIKFGKKLSDKIGNITSPELQQYRAIDEADRNDLFGAIIKTLYNTGALKCSVGFDENDNCVLYAAINLAHPTDEMLK